MMRLPVSIALMLVMMPAAFAATPAHGDAHAAAEAGGASLPQLDLATFPSQAFWLFVTFFTIYVVVKSVIMPQIGGTLDARDAHIESQLREAETLNASALDLQRDFDASMVKARQEAQVEIAKARAEVVEKLADAEERQNDVFKNSRNKFTGSYREQRARIMEGLEAEARNFAAELATKILSASSSKNKKAA